MLDKEIWKDIEGYEGLYQVSNMGRVRSLDRYVNHSSKTKQFKKGKILKPQPIKTGYLRVFLQSNGKVNHFLVHRIVANTFLNNIQKNLEINHIDGNKQNNSINNLEYCTHSENMRHAINNKLQTAIIGENHCMAKLSNNQADEIRKEYVSRNKKHSLRELAIKYNVSQKTIYNIIHNKSYYNPKHTRQ